MQNFYTDAHNSEYNSVEAKLRKTSTIDNHQTMELLDPLALCMSRL